MRHPHNSRMDVVEAPAPAPAPAAGALRVHSRHMGIKLGPHCWLIANPHHDADAKRARSTGYSGSLPLTTVHVWSFTIQDTVRIQTCFGLGGAFATAFP